MDLYYFLNLASDLEVAGLLWQPEIGDEVSNRKVEPAQISILVDPMGLTPLELRDQFLWLPSVEQMVVQMEMRQTILFHAGLELSEDKLCYKAVIQGPVGHIEAVGESLRTAVGLTLRDLLLSDIDAVH